MASLRSFLAHAGAPASWTVVSDGTHSGEERELLAAIHPCVSVRDWRDRANPHLPRILWDYAAVDALGKKLIALVSLPADAPVLYTDADVLYFAGAARAEELVRPGGSPRYMGGGEVRRQLTGGDARLGRFALDSDLLASESEADGEVNSGFLLLEGRLDWGPAVKRLAGRRRRPTFLTEQTVVHLTLSRASCRPLDPARYVLTAADRWGDRDEFAGPGIVLRHYVTPVRHKLWQAIEGYGWGD